MCRVYELCYLCVCGDCLLRHLTMLSVCFYVQVMATACWGIELCYLCVWGDCLLRHLTMLSVCLWRLLAEALNYVICVFVCAGFMATACGGVWPCRIICIPPGTFHSTAVWCSAWHSRSCQTVISTQTTQKDSRPGQVSVKIMMNNYLWLGQKVHYFGIHL